MAQALAGDLSLADFVTASDLGQPPAQPIRLP